VTERIRRAAAVALLAGAAGAGVPHAAAGQGIEPPPIVLPTPGAGTTPTIYLMTFGRGDAVWERYAHNAVRVVDPVAGTDLAYNWGEFDFDQPNFIGRFLTGDTKYAMHAIDAPAMAEVYARRFNRAVWLQELAIPPAAARALADSLVAFDTEARRYYRYDYYNDNCSTRVRDALDVATGGALRRALTGRPSGTTWRRDTRRLNAGDAPIYTGIQVALGRPADDPLDRWQSAYLPLDLREAVRGVRVAGAGGTPAPLVVREYEVWGAPGREPEPQRVPSYAAGYAAAGIGLAAVIAGLGAAARRGGVAARAALAATAGLWSLAVGLLGGALFLAGTVTKHAAYMGRNWNLLGVNPLSLLVAVLVVAAVVGRGIEGRHRRARRAARAAGLVAVLAVFGTVLVLLPGAGQRSAELFALLVPVHLAVWWAFARLGAAGDDAAAGRGESAAAAPSLVGRPV
jgi:hypothetical protein